MKTKLLILTLVSAITAANLWAHEGGTATVSGKGRVQVCATGACVGYYCQGTSGDCSVTFPLP